MKRSDLVQFFNPPNLPFGIRLLRDSVVVILFIAVGNGIGAIPYEAGKADPLMVRTFMAVFGTLGFALVAYHATSRRSLHLLGCVGLIWFVLGFLTAIGGAHPMTWVVELVLLAVMAVLGAGLALLFERLARD